MLCESLYGGHILTKGDIMQIGYSNTELTWLYLVQCGRCGRTAIIDRKYLDRIISKEYGKPTDEPDQTGS